MPAISQWDALCEAYLAADELVSSLMLMLAEMTSAGSVNQATPEIWALLRDARSARNEAEGAMVEYMSRRDRGGLL